MNQSKMKDRRFWRIWANAGAVQTPIEFLPGEIAAIAKNFVIDAQGWDTISVIPDGQEQPKIWFMVRSGKLKCHSRITVLPNNALPTEFFKFS